MTVQLLIRTLLVEKMLDCWRKDNSECTQIINYGHIGCRSYPDAAPHSISNAGTSSQ